MKTFEELILTEDELNELNQLKNHEVIGQSKDKILIPNDYQYIYDNFQIVENQILNSLSKNYLI